MAASLSNLPLEQQDGQCLMRVATRPSSLRIHRREAVSEVSFPGSSHSSPSADDPDLPDAFIMVHGGFLVRKLPVTGI